MTAEPQYEWGPTTIADSGPCVFPAGAREMTVAVTCPSVVAVHPGEITIEDEDGGCVIKSLFINLNDIVQARGVPVSEWNKRTRFQLGDYSPSAYILVSPYHGIGCRLLRLPSDKPLTVRVKVIAVPFVEKKVGGS